jgi:hypothetical protein
MLLINGLMTQYIGVAMEEKLMVQKMVLANQKAPALLPLHDLYNGTPCSIILVMQWE